MTNQSRVDVLRRILWLFVATTTVAVSLLVYPNVLLWMVAFWLVVASVAVGRSRAAWIPLGACVVVLLIKRPDWSPALTSLAASTTAVAVIFFWKQNTGNVADGQRRLALSAIGLLWVLWFAAAWESYAGSHCGLATRLDSSRPIACIGDSLTTGLSDDEAYPAYLQQLVTVPVLDFGRAGITAQDAFKQLPSAHESQPQIVVVELGGHDFLRGYGRAATRKTLVKIIEACRDAGAAVVLIEIPRGFITDEFSGLERQLAREYDLELVPDTAIRMLVVQSPAIPVIGGLAQPHLSDDGLHPNVDGAKFLAETICQSLVRMYGPEIESKSERPFLRDGD